MCAISRKSQGGKTHRKGVVENYYGCNKQTKYVSLNEEETFKYKVEYVVIINYVIVCWVAPLFLCSGMIRVHLFVDTIA